VEVGVHDARRLGLRPGGTVRIVSGTGEAVVPVSVREDLEPGVALVPFSCREAAAGVLAGSFRTEVRLERA
jgi:predicted molibdopterin-dependent oxidoreductase YjgC